MRAIEPEEMKLIVVGRPVPFSVYSHDKTLLLVAGRVVPNEFVRDGLLRSGKFRGNEDSAPAFTAAAEEATNDAIATLQADYQHTHARSTVGFRMERENQTYTARVIGVGDDGHGLIMSTPTLANGSRVTLKEGDTWLFRAIYALAAVRFQAVIEKVGDSPFPYFYASRITDIERREVRHWPRIPTCLWASRAGEAPRIIADLSVGGARVAVDERSHLQVGQVLLLTTYLTPATGAKELSIDALVKNKYGRVDPRHPRVEFYGVEFENVNETQKVLLHAFVQEQLCMDLDRIWHVLSLAH